MENGLRYRFECTGCGNCCRWPGHVLLDDADIRRLAEAKGLPDDEFIQRFTDLARNRGQLTLKDAADGACIFLEGNRCSMYSARPRQCRIFPFPWTTPAECPGLVEECRE